jgi:hypothetical protein
MLRLHHSFCSTKWSYLWLWYVTAWIHWCVTGDNIHLISYAKLHTTCFPKLNLSLMHIKYVFTYSVDVNVWEGTIENRLKIRSHLTCLLPTFPNSDACCMEDVEDWFSLLQSLMEDSMKANLGTRDTGFILDHSWPWGMRFHIVTTLQIVADQMMDNG